MRHDRNIKKYIKDFQVIDVATWQSTLSRLIKASLKSLKMEADSEQLRYN